MKLKHLFLLICGTLLFACENEDNVDDLENRVPIEKPNPLDVFDDADAIEVRIRNDIFSVYSDIGVKDYLLFAGLKHNKIWIGIVEQTAQDQYEKYYEWTDKTAIETVKNIDVGYGEVERYAFKSLQMHGIGLNDKNYIFTFNQIYQGSKGEIGEARLLVIKEGAEIIKNLQNTVIEAYKWHGDTVLFLSYNGEYIYTCYDSDGNLVQQIVLNKYYEDIDKVQPLRIDRGLFIDEGAVIYSNFTTGQVICQVKFDDLPSNARVDDFEIIEQSNGTAKIKVNHTLYSGEKAARECSINIETGEITYL